MKVRLALGLSKIQKKHLGQFQNYVSRHYKMLVIQFPVIENVSLAIDPKFF